MKTKIIYTVIFLLSLSMYGQNRGFNYKVLISDNGSALANHSVTIKFSLLRYGTTLVYEETHSTTTDDNGIVSVAIGEGDTSDDFSSLEWETYSYFLKVEIDTGSGYQDFGTNEFKAVPYAKYAETGGSVKILQDLENVRESHQSLFLFSDAPNNTGASNLAIGLSTLYSNTTAWGNIALGNGVLSYNTTGNNNLAIGYDALNKSTTSGVNLALGNTVLKNYTGTSGYNIGIGPGALTHIITGEKNTVIGVSAAYAGATGSRNVYLGFETAYNATGNNNVFIGHRAGFNETGSNKLYIENSNSSSPLIYGEFDNDLLKINGTLQVADGSQGNGKVLTSDANGVASWQTPATFTDLWSSNGSNIYRNTGNVGIGTGTPDAPLEIRSDASPSLIIGSYSPNYNVRPGIQFKYNTSQYISGDDESNEIFGFYSQWANTRTYDAKLRVYGKATSSWGKYIEITHDGTDATIKTDSGNISLEPQGGEVQVPGKITAPATGSNDLKAFAYGTIHSDGSIYSGTGNFQVDHSVGAGIYKITFTGENYNNDDFTSIVSVISNTPKFIFSYATNNTLVVKTFNMDGTTREDQVFTFVTYKN